MNNKKAHPFLGFLRLIGIYLGRLTAVAVIVASVGYGLYYAQSSSYGKGRFPVARIDYLGIQNVDRHALDGLVRRSLPENLLQVDLDHVREIIESEPWVKLCTVRRVLPDRLVVRLTERRAAAVATIDGDFYVVDDDGRVLDLYGPNYQSLDGPIVKGLMNLARENAREDNLGRMQAYLRVLADLKRSPKDYPAFISEINVEDPRRIALIPTEEPVPVFVGDSSFLKRYETFLSCMSLYQQLKSQYGTIEYVDVTYDDKVIFHTPEKSQEQRVEPDARF